ncbi:hypothetical protein FIBSPDRAFT_909748 [Athelia psychrophila]|uniref:Non-structural maintenance of chromosomes element 1 homolog n=1 Tax=Athelia psychrophila TaxID=1759441 RepID=A0A166NA12_9AGAM|nr:hypothetical protein FIBSPDRAFT_909748 [Fibularhizoctonia sp. CBS 109695]
MVSSNDVSRLFLQAVLSRGMLSEKLAMTLWAKCIDAVKGADESLDIPHNGSKASWEAFSAKINDSLDPLDLHFGGQQDETTGRRMWAIVNKKGDDIAQMATDYSAQEIAYFKAIVEQIMLARHEAYSISSFAALREVNNLKSNMSKTQAEVVLGSFVAKGWLLKSSRARYSLSTRTLLELSKYLKETYSGELIECTLCMEILTRGIACFTPNCKTRMHRHCFKNYRRNPKTTGCPSCKIEWPQDYNVEGPLLPVGEDAVKDGQDEGGRRPRRKSTVEGSDEEDAEDDDEEEEEPSQPASTKKKGRTANATQDDDDDDDEEEEEEEEEQYAPKRRGRG